jgi:hypothetical protein
MYRLELIDNCVPTNFDQQHTSVCAAYSVSSHRDMCTSLHSVCVLSLSACCCVSDCWLACVYDVLAHVLTTTAVESSKAQHSKNRRTEKETETQCTDHSIRVYI